MTNLLGQVGGTHLSDTAFVSLVRKRAPCWSELPTFWT